MIYQTPHIEQINSLFKERNETLPLKNENKIRLEKKYRLEFNYNSNHLEGNTLTYGQTQLLLFFDKSSGDVPMSDLEEMKAHDAAMRIIQEMAADKERPLTEQFIKELNKIILVRPFWKEAITESGQETRKRIIPGEYKSLPNSVRLRNGEIHHYASPGETPAKMNDLMDWYHSEKDKMHPVQLAAEFHYRFVCIHPFDDGNGRVARLVMNYILLFFNYPMVIIKSKDKENYLTALQKADVGERQAIIEYVEKQMLWSLKLELKAANGDDLEEDDDIDKEIELLKREKLNTTYLRKNDQIVKEITLRVNDEIYETVFRRLEKFQDFFEEIVPNKLILFSISDKNQRKIAASAKELRLKELSTFFIYDQSRSFNIKDASWLVELKTLKHIFNDMSIKIKIHCIFRQSNYRIITSLKINYDKPHSYVSKDYLYDKSNFSEYLDDMIKGVSTRLLEIVRKNDQSLKV